MIDTTGAKRRCGTGSGEQSSLERVESCVLVGRTEDDPSKGKQSCRSAITCSESLAFQVRGDRQQPKGLVRPSAHTRDLDLVLQQQLGNTGNILLPFV